MAGSEKNFFARVETLAELDSRFEMMVSPENLYADGERSHAEAERLYNRLRHDYQHRQSEIRLAALNAARNAQA
jgi:hypothetical protein